MSERYETVWRVADLVQDKTLKVIPKTKTINYVLEDADEYLLKNIYYPQGKLPIPERKRKQDNIKVIIDDVLTYWITHWRNSVLI
jgi:hypothetical protein